MSVTRAGLEFACKVDGLLCIPWRDLTRYLDRIKSFPIVLQSRSFGFDVTCVGFSFMSSLSGNPFAPGFVLRSPLNMSLLLLTENHHCRFCVADYQLKNNHYNNHNK